MSRCRHHHRCGCPRTAREQRAYDVERGFNAVACAILFLTVVVALLAMGVEALFS